ncbi:alpha-hydroxy acid oxidase [Burkholderia stabilis]|uniref:FMN hydroxy acid dehydrogenase domain-containing protein n=1 Tax=Burkholderia stabilis TaxID=95485 RepID=A0AAJ5T5A6_9BURK|nr:alpha-hydroxy acid oxidase [Burkholderia stabilis]VBB13440.1 L-lactate dehydrogenase [cytochrome],L-lactate dehydrogenase,L-lactate dehydrogenase (FMN-dependent) and related alpha-hydroxy acid dehydrogenases,heme/flavin dehydrogenase, mycofactocin system,FMN-dependent dehydrogenase [Burkholderia stabilis]HDR9582495.1 alpha-hydroxy-acid oxidizing protein [Burkholderia stabilis]HDR9589474.1 alpha-hydroxy-acid oxidizing protein [Burkholderia stabilis]HDR9648030.1 alpha-hydroxy-acid oxidizing pr
MPVITCLDDLRLLAKRRVPRMFYDYVDSGSWTETTYRANEADFARILFRQRVMGNLASRSTAVVMAGQPAVMPVAIAPVGLTGMLHADGEIHAARAAEKFGIPFTLSTMSICSIEDVAANTKAPFWFQLYMMRDRDAMVRMIDRCKAARCSALMVTVDIQVPGQRHKDLKNGMTVPPRPTLSNLVNLASRLRWCSGMARTKRRTFGNLVGHVQSVSNIRSLSAWSSEQFDPRLCWDDISWIRRQWDGKLIVKGIMDAEDAALAVAHGADVVVVSNHGGRVLDHAPSSIRALPAIVDAIGHTSEVWMDGGIRTGQDVLKAWALGARGTLIGRAMVYGLGAMGEAGVSKALQILHKELDVTMAHCGHTDIAKVDRSILIQDTF